MGLNPVASQIAKDRRGASDRRPRSFWVLLLGIMIVGVAARGAAIWQWSENLSDDRDVYLALAEGVASGRGFSVPGTDIPTAYRPPMYVMFLVATESVHSLWVRAFWQVVLGTATVGLTYGLGRQLALGAPLSLFAAMLVAVDPLLVRYATFPMTETFVTFLTTAFLVTVQSRPAYPPSKRRQVLNGFLFGLCVLSRPTLWAFGGLLAAWWLMEQVRERTASNSTRETPRWPWAIATALTLTVAPWVVRNQLAMGKPIAMTTHGGYTLLLGNNPAYYREVVAQPWGTVWDGSVGKGQAAWVQSLNREMDDAGIEGEIARDRWMSRRAWSHMTDDPWMFLRACLLRLRAFWALAPGGSTAGAATPTVTRLVTAFYAVTFVLAAIGLIRVLISGAQRWMPCLLLLTSFVGVHLFYWTDARMRAPVIPVIALLAARGLQRPARVDLISTSEQR